MCKSFTAIRKEVISTSTTLVPVFKYYSNLPAPGWYHVAKATTVPLLLRPYLPRIANADNSSFAVSAEYSPAGILGSYIENTSWSVSANVDHRFFNGCKCGKNFLAFQKSLKFA